MPKISIIVPNYNHARYLERRLESVYGQTFRDCEVILLDDRSSDDSRAILERFPKTLPTRCVFNEANSGSPFLQWLKGFSLAEGEYVWIAESDDVAEPRFLEVLAARLDAAPRAALAFAQSRVIDRDGRDGGLYTEVVNTRHAARYRADFASGGADECANFLIRENLIPNASAALFRRELAAGAGPLLAGARYMGDWLLYLHLLTQGDLCFVAEPLNSYRFHPGNQTHSEKSLAGAFPERVRGVGWLSRRIAVPRRALARAGDELLAHGAALPGRFSCDGLRRLRLIRREGGIPWSLLVPGLFRLAGRKAAARLRRRKGR